MCGPSGTQPARQHLCDSLMPRVQYWMHQFRQFGAATESSIQMLHDDTVYFIGLEGTVRVFDINLHSGMALVPTPPRFNQASRCVNNGLLSDVHCFTGSHG